MTTLISLEALAAWPEPRHLAIGVFDGVHLGHQAVIGSALTAGGVSVVVTFDPHPMAVLRPAQRPVQLTTAAERAYILAELGVQVLVVLPFTRELAQQAAEVFAASLKRAVGQGGSVSVGETWRFGARAAGDVALLERCGLTVRAVAAVKSEGGVISSTRIRDALSRGEVPQARAWLGRLWAASGVVESGRQLARQLGCPTANVRPEGDAPLADGVYAVWVTHAGVRWPGVANWGLRPTVEDAGARRLEIHLIGFNGDLYGQRIRAEFVAFLRPERRFDGLEPLRAQIAADVVAARQAMLAETVQG
jgi:riboflavin kinase / FMN adenylyltransferase